jgi:hypothetical protein
VSVRSDTLYRLVNTGLASASFISQESKNALTGLIVTFEVVSFLAIDELFGKELLDKDETVLNELVVTYLIRTICFGH